MIKPRQRHARGARQIAHRRTLISFFTEDLGSMVKNVAESAIEASCWGAIRNCTGSSSRAAGGSGCGESGHANLDVRSNVRSKYRAKAVEITRRCDLVLIAFMKAQ